MDIESDGYREAEAKKEIESASPEALLYREVDFEMRPKMLFPVQSQSPDIMEDELTQEALADPDSERTKVHDQSPTLWRIVVLVAFAVIALGIVFLWHK